MLRGIVGAVLVSGAAWIVMRTIGWAGPDADLYADLLRDSGRAAVDALRWLIGAAEYPQRAVLILSAAAGFMLGAKAGR